MPNFKLSAKPVCSPEVDSQIGVYAVQDVPLTLASVALFERGKGEARLSKFLEIGLPDVATWVANGSRTAFWTAPGQWFVTCPESETPSLFNDLSHAVGADAAVTDQSGGWTCFDVSGPELTSVLEKLVGFDVAAAEAGTAQRTSIEHISCFVLCKSQEDARILCPRSYARSLHHALTQAFRSQLAYEASSAT